jgi:2-oxoglutarate ferredoxin oxidoreductase subunit delta
MTAKGHHPAELIAEGCTGCGICAIVCPEAAITVYREVVNRESTRFQAG